MLSEKGTKTKSVGGIVHVIEHLPSRHEILSSNPILPKGEINIRNRYALQLTDRHKSASVHCQLYI
jgi:hypothetical protein